MDLRDFAKARTSDLLAWLNPDVLVNAVGDGDLTKDQVYAFMTAIAAELDRRIPVRCPDWECVGRMQLFGHGLSFVLFAVDGSPAPDEPTLKAGDRIAIGPSPSVDPRNFRHGGAAHEVETITGLTVAMGQTIRNLWPAVADGDYVFREVRP